MEILGYEVNCIHIAQSNATENECERNQKQQNRAFEWCTQRYAQLTKIFINPTNGR